MSSSYSLSAIIILLLIMMTIMMGPMQVGDPDWGEYWDLCLDRTLVKDWSSQAYRFIIITTTTIIIIIGKYWRG